MQESPAGAAPAVHRGNRNSGCRRAGPSSRALSPPAPESRQDPAGAAASVTSGEGRPCPARFWTDRRGRRCHGTDPPDSSPAEGGPAGSAVRRCRRPHPMRSRTMAPASRIPAVEGPMAHWPGQPRRPGGGLQLGSGGRLLRAEHHLQVADATGAQFLPHDTGQRAAAGLGDVRHPQQGGGPACCRSPAPTGWGCFGPWPAGSDPACRSPDRCSRQCSHIGRRRNSPDGRRRRWRRWGG